MSNNGFSIMDGIYFDNEKGYTSMPNIYNEPILHIDSTPDKDYVLRILRTYRENCNVKWSKRSDIQEDPDGEIFKIMNQTQDKRAKLLDEAIIILEEYYSKKNLNMSKIIL